MRFIFLLGIFICFSSCELFNKPETIPAYLKVNNVSLNTDVSTQGANTHAIVDAWIYINNEPLAVIELPGQIPVLEKGATSITIFPGIKQNGFEAQREIYPFYQAFQIDTFLYEDSVVTISPKFTYKSNANILWNEDFEGLQVDLDSSQFSLANIVAQTSVVKSGLRAGQIQVTPDKYFAEIITGTKVNLSSTGNRSYFEIDFNSTTDFELYFITNRNDGSIFREQIIYLAQTNNTWKKVYIELTNFAAFNPDAQNYQLAIRLDLSENNTATHNIYLDNLKIISE